GGTDVHAEALGDDGVGVALGEELGDGALAGGDAVDAAQVGGPQVHRWGQPPEAVEGGAEVGDDRRVPDLDGHGAVLVGGEERDLPVDEDEAVHDLVQCADLDVALQPLVAGRHDGKVADRGLVQGADAAAAVQEALVPGERDDVGYLAPAAGQARARLRGEHFVARLVHGFRDGLVDPRRPAEHPEGRWVGGCGAAVVEAQQRLEGVGQLFFLPAYLR